MRWNTVWRSVATFANVTYSLRRALYHERDIRYEGTNRMGRSHSARWLPTWNLSGAWNAHEEKLFSKSWNQLFHTSL